MQSKGLGDTIHQVASFFGIRPTPGCNCEANREKLNKAVPYSKAKFKRIIKFKL